MKNLISRTIFTLIVLCILPVQYAVGEDNSASLSLPNGVTQLGLLTVGNKDIYMPIPSNYPLKASGQKVGPNRLWLEESWVPVGQTPSNFNEILTLLILPSNAPPIEVMSAQLSRMCPKSFFKRNADPPKFIVDQGNTTAVVMGCEAEGSPVILHGYYVAIQNHEHNYLLGRELIGTTSKIDLNDENLISWQSVFSKFAVCNKGEFCAKLN